MSANPYVPPRSDPKMEEPVISASPEVLKKIKNAWIAGIISTAITLVFTLLAMFGTSLMGFSSMQLFDVALMAGLTYGIYRNSRVCAVAMLIYFVVSKILLFEETGKVTGAYMAVVFFYYYAQGVAGTFAYHKQLKAD